MYVYICLHKFGIGLFSFFVPLAPLGLIKVRHNFPKKVRQCHNARVRTLLKPLCIIYTVNPRTLADPP